MSIKEPSFTIGVEEEYLLVDKETRGLVVEPPESLMAEAEERRGAQVTSELLKSQIEIGTKVCNNIQEAREDLARLRRNIIEVADNHGIAPDVGSRLLMHTGLERCEYRHAGAQAPGGDQMTLGRVTGHTGLLS